MTDSTLHLHENGTLSFLLPSSLSNFLCPFQHHSFFLSLLSLSQCSPIHDHASSHCFVKVLSGTLTETLYKPPGEVMVRQTMTYFGGGGSACAVVLLLLFLEITGKVLDEGLCRCSQFHLSRAKSSGPVSMSLWFVLFFFLPLFALPNFLTFCFLPLISLVLPSLSTYSREHRWSPLRLPTQAKTPPATLMVGPCEMWLKSLRHLGRNKSFPVRMSAPSYFSYPLNSLVQILSFTIFCFNLMPRVCLSSSRSLHLLSFIS